LLPQLDAVVSAGSVLIVDDDLDLRATMEAVLVDEGFSVTLAADGHEALAAARAQRPCMILLDLSLPGMSGWEVVDALQTDAQVADVPVVVISGDRVRVRTPIVEALQKPVDLSRLVEVVEAHCG
jgi:two-component system response regulator MprA